MQDQLRGFIANLIYRNEANAYTVFSLEDENKEEHTCFGFLESVRPGEFVEVTGAFVNHRVYGRQFKVEKYEIQRPEDKDSLERYLGSGAIKGIGPKLAARIVETFGAETLDIMKDQPERLAEVKGISENRAQDIAAQMAEREDTREAMMFLQSYGISLKLGLKVYKVYGPSMYTILREDPYKLADDIKGIGFRTADEIAEKMGIRKDSECRVRSAALYILSQATGEGSMYLPEDVLISKTKELTGAEDDAVRNAVWDLMADRKVIIGRAGIPDFGAEDRDGGECAENTESVNIVYPSSNYYTELSVARRLCDLNVILEDDDKKIQRSIERLQKDSDTVLEERQIEACAAAVRYGVMILTGGPGTGKTTTINEMIRYFKSEGMEVTLAAPTGRAAKRMTETSHYEASTIHRLLEIGRIPEGENDPGDYIYGRNELNPIETDVLIIDEMSMVDIFLMDALLKALARGTRLILVGDEDQLPSVGPGCVLADMIDSGAFHTVRLEQIFRQSQESDIIVNSHRINKGLDIKLDNKSRDFFFLERQDPKVILGNILELIQKKLPSYVDAKPYEIQVLSPMRKGRLGVERLNVFLQRFLNPPGRNKKEHEWDKGVIREGDKVMQIKNNYDLTWEIFGKHGIRIDYGTGVYNGDIGIVREIDDFARIVAVEFDEGKTVEYAFEDLDELELAYCTTIHKAQGSEYPAVIIPVLQGPAQLLTRNLLYTAVTRARKCVMLIGSSQVIRGMIGNTRTNSRYTSLDERIEEIEKYR